MPENIEVNIFLEDGRLKIPRSQLVELLGASLPDYFTYPDNILSLNFISGEESIIDWGERSKILDHEIKAGQIITIYWSLRHDAVENGGSITITKDSDKLLYSLAIPRFMLMDKPLDAVEAMWRSIYFQVLTFTECVIAIGSETNIEFSRDSSLSTVVQYCLSSFANFYWLIAPKVYLDATFDDFDAVWSNEHAVFLRRRNVELP